MTPEERAAQIADAWGKSGTVRRQLIDDIAYAIRTAEAEAERRGADAEREACARLADPDGLGCDIWEREEVAAAIRGRSSLLPTAGRHTCPCCGHPGLREPAYRGLPEGVRVRGLPPPYRRYFGEPSHEVCACCGYEFGNDDEPGTGPAQSFETYLAEWVRGGCVWFTPEAKPAGWSYQGDRP